jgi:hypothetical protein
LVAVISLNRDASPRVRRGSPSQILKYVVMSVSGHTGDYDTGLVAFLSGGCRRIDSYYDSDEWRVISDSSLVKLSESPKSSIDLVYDLSVKLLTT